MNWQRSGLIAVFICLLSCKLYSLPPSHIEMWRTSKAFSQLAQAYEQSLFDYAPELGAFWGRKDVALDRFMDYSVEATDKWHRQEDNFLLTLNTLDPNKLLGTSNYYTYLLFKETLENKIASRICKEELWDVNPLSGWHNKMSITAANQPVGSAQYRQLALKRWQTFNQVVDTQIENLQLGVKLSYTAPKPAVKRVLTQLKIILNSPVDQSPFFDFAKRDGNDAFKEKVATLIQTTINPSLKKYIDYLENDYLTFARNDIGVWALPSGLECYQSKIKEETTLAITPNDIHTLGLTEIQNISNEIAQIGEKNYGTKNIKTIFSKAKKESSHAFSSENDILKYNLAALNRAKAKVIYWFELMPHTEGGIKPYPLHLAITGAAGQYQPPSEDGTTPGIFYINTFKPEQSSRIDQEATLFHELIPGHHLQVALSYENKSLPSLNKYLWNSGYGEGWALYAERLADEMGLYNDDISRLGMLSNESLRAARLVVDTGIHAMHWSREQAIAYLAQHTALNDAIIQGEVDRYIMMPGQATAYMLGKCEILELRHAAQQRLGEHFNIRQFHNQVLNHGVVSLPLLKKIISDWITEEEKKHALH